jgi:hypothetical protein
VLGEQQLAEEDAEYLESFFNHVSGSVYKLPPNILTKWLPRPVLIDDLVDLSRELELVTV